jgi:hypothetical protein
MAALSLIASIAVVIIVYRIGVAAFSAVAGLIAAAATALSMPLVILTVQLRPYGLLSLLILISHGALWAWWTGRGDRWLRVWLAATVLLPYLHHVSVLLLAGQALVVLWLQWRASPLDRGRWRLLLGHAVLLGILALPAAYLLVSQSATAAYPSPKPFMLVRPFVALGVLALTLPLEVLLPLIVAAAALFGLRSRSPSLHVFAGPRVLLTLAAPMFFVLATLATYRSLFLVPHLLLSVAPLGMLLAGAYVAGVAEAGHRWRAMVWAEILVVMVGIGLVFSTGFAKTNTDLVARSVAAASQPGDLVLLVPGAAGASFNRYFRRAASRIDFPYPGRLGVYRFDGDFARIADPAALQMARDSVHAAFESGRRVWLVTFHRWLNSRVPTPEVLVRDSFGGIGQADRSRANRLDRYLRWLYGPPESTMTTDSTLPGYEQLIARLYARRPPAGARASDDQTFAREHE